MCKGLKLNTKQHDCRLCYEIFKNKSDLTRYGKVHINHEDTEQTNNQNKFENSVRVLLKAFQFLRIIAKPISIRQLQMTY